MLRATVWTVGLFGAATAISQLLPGTWTEPLVLLALGIALLFVSARTARTTLPRRAAAERPPRSAEAPAVASGKPAAAIAAAAATVQGGSVQVERTA